MTVPYKHGQIQEPAVKLKDIGKFKRLIADSKVQCILQYDPDRSWNKLELEKELESYENIRRDILLKNIQSLECNILQHMGFDGVNHIRELEQDGFPNFKCYVANGLLKNSADVADSDIKWLLGKFDGSFESELTLNELKEKPEVLQKGFMLVYIRNKIAHNQMLKAGLYDYLLDICQEKRLDDETYCDTILRCTGKIIVDLTEDFR